MMRLGVTFTTEMLAGVLIMSLVSSISCLPSLTPDRSTETRRLEGFRRLKACSGPDRVPFASVIFVPSMTHWGERFLYSMGRVKSRRTRSF